MDLKRCLLVFILIIQSVHGARILFSCPSASYSHQIFFRKIWLELASKGHDLVVLTTNVYEDAPKNVRQIDWSQAYHIRQNVYNVSNIYLDNTSFFQKLKTFGKWIEDTNDYEMSHPDVQALINNKNEHFDLVINEIHFEVFNSFAARFGCPLVVVSSAEITNPQYEQLGVPSHPIQYSDMMLPFFGPQSFKERLISTGFYLFLKTSLFNFMNDPNIQIRKYFGPTTPTAAEVLKNVSLVLINSHTVYNSRPLLPWIIRIGGNVHLTEPKELSKDIKDFLDSASNGVIYLSFGTNVKSDHVTPELQRTILETFKDLPYKILWKFETVLETDNKNFKFAKWLPQQDVLRHKNIKLFITQGGAQSVEESISNHVPMLVIPFVSDQKWQAKKITKLGLGLSLDKSEITKDVLKKTIMDVIGTPKYKQTVKELSNVFNDQPMSGLDTAVWWIEYVIRHKGIKYLKSSFYLIPWYQYYFLDVGFTLFVILFVLYQIFRLICRLIVNKFRKIKTE